MAGCRLIVHADDLGLSEEINKGILLAHKEGIVTSASIVSAGAAFEQAMELCKAYPSLDIGIHLTLVEESAITEKSNIESLLGADGRFHADAISFTRRYLLGRIDLQQVRREFDAQIKRVLGYGIPISHMDSHQHTHALPGIRRVAIELGKQYDIPAIRLPSEMPKAYMLHEKGSLVRLAQLIVLNALCRFRGKEDVVSTDEFVGFFYGGNLHKENLKKVLQQLPQSGSCELMCHPGILEIDPRYKHWGYNQAQELEALTSIEISQILKDNGIELISYRDLIIDGRD